MRLVYGANSKITRSAILHIVYIFKCGGILKFNALNEIRLLSVNLRNIFTVYESKAFNMRRKKELCKYIYSDLTKNQCLYCGSYTTVQYT